MVQTEKLSGVVAQFGQDAPILSTLYKALNYAAAALLPFSTLLHESKMDTLNVFVPQTFSKFCIPILKDSTTKDVIADIQERLPEFFARNSSCEYLLYLLPSGYYGDEKCFFDLMKGLGQLDLTPEKLSGNMSTNCMPPLPVHVRRLGPLVLGAKTYRFCLFDPDERVLEKASGYPKDDMHAVFLRVMTNSETATMLL